MKCFPFNFYQSISISFLLGDFCQIMFRQVESLLHELLAPSFQTLILKLHTQKKDRTPNQTTPSLIKLYAVIFGISETPMLALSPHSQLSFHSARKKNKVVTEPSTPTNKTAAKYYHPLLFYSRAG